MTYLTAGTSTYGIGGTTSTALNYMPWIGGTATINTGTTTASSSNVISIDTSDHMFDKMDLSLLNGTKIIMSGKGCIIEMLDGSILTIEDNGNYHVQDKNAKTIYTANTVREFNRYINTSDLLEEFIRFLGTEFGVRQNQIMDVPIDIFINWLIVQAAIKDGDNYDKDMKLLTDGVTKEKNWYRRCRCCGKYIQKKMYEAGLLFCNSVCFEHHQLRIQ